MRESMNQVRDLLKSKIQCIWIDTYEEAAAINDLKEVVNGLPGLNLHTWSHTEGLRKLPLTDLEKPEKPDPKMANPQNLFNAIREAQEDTNTKREGVYLLRDFHLLNDTHAIKRGLRDIKEYPSKNYNPIIVVSPVVNIPVEHEKLFTIVTYDVPSRKEVEQLIASMANNIEKAISNGRNFTAPTEKQQVQLVNACIGLTFNEISDVFAKSLVKFKELSLQAVMEEKMQLVKKAGVLDYVIPRFNFDDIGGNQAFKEWVLEVEDAYSDEAIEFGVTRPKGYLALGIPGTSKTVSAEAIANKWGFPLLKLNMSKIMDKLVGQSERKIDQAFRVAKACSPCVLLMDEVEKMMGGISSSNNSDSGTLARVFGKTLEFLNEDNNVFVVMTSNDVSQLPPELTRAGRLDAMWYFSLPTKEERKEIFRIHLEKTGKEVTPELIEKSAKVSENFTGAEIAEVAKNSMRKAYKRFKSDGVNALLPLDVEEAAKEIIPLYRSSKEKILALEAWAQGRARSTNCAETSGVEESNNEQLLGDILELER
ncbi:AAA family ATPase [Bacillus atrophaeus]|uniref:AAA family ATPase n=1 Tax=Bacillus atrophaeus TaxID=1452 RepID=UPI002E1AB21A|nr:AAA family ATPase [Bacillus atrophaeus]